MLDEILDIFDRDRKSEPGRRKSGLGGLIQRITGGDHDERRDDHRRRDSRSWQRDDDHYDDDDRRDSRGRQRRDRDFELFDD